MFSKEDIVAMKVQAILGRGKKKDFWDIAELLKHFSVKDFVQFHKEKFSTQNLLITVPQAMTYFTDAEEEGTVQTEEVYLKIESDKVTQIRGELVEDASGKLIAKDKIKSILKADNITGTSIFIKEQLLQIFNF